MSFSRKFPDHLPRGIGIAVCVIAIVVWLVGGAHPGWTQTEVTVWLVDEVTGIEYPETHDGLLPGIEFPVLGIAVLTGFAILDVVLSQFRTRN